jgi:hypothetical protein
MMFMIFWTDCGYRYWAKQTWTSKLEVEIFLAWLLYDAIKIWLKEPRVIYMRPKLPLPKKKKKPPTNVGKQQPDSSGKVRSRSPTRSERKYSRPSGSIPAQNRK